MGWLGDALGTWADPSGAFSNDRGLGVLRNGGSESNQKRALLDPTGMLIKQEGETDLGPGVDISGYPQITSLLDANGNLLPQYRLNAQSDVGFTSNLQDLQSRLSGINLNTDALQALRKRGLSQGPSEWANLMTQKQGLEENQALQNAVEQSRSGLSSAYSDLASRGGLSSGARERLAMAGSKDLNAGRQGVRLEGQKQRLGIGTEDEQKRLEILSALPGMEVQSLQPELAKTSLYSNLAESEAGRKQNLDISNRGYKTDVEKANLASLFGEVGRQDASKMDFWKTQMQTQAAEKQAQATANAGKGGGGLLGTWICTEVNKVNSISDEDRKELRKLRGYSVKNHRDMATLYFGSFEKVINVMKEELFDFKTLVPFTNAVINLMKMEEPDLAIDLYWDKIKELISKYYTKLNSEEFDVVSQIDKNRETQYAVSV